MENSIQKLGVSTFISFQFGADGENFSGFNLSIDTHILDAIITSRTASQIQGRILSYLVSSHKTSGLSSHSLIDCGVSESPASLSWGCLQPYVLSTISKTLFGLNRGQSDFCRPVGEMLLITATWLWKMPHVRLQMILCRALQRLLKVCVGKRTLRPNA